MDVRYKVYGDGGTGRIDYSVPIGATAALSFVVGPIADGTYVFGVRAYDADTGLEELNTDARATLVVLAGADVSGRPGPVRQVKAFRRAGLKVEVRWSYARTPGMPDPRTFKVWVTDGASVDYDASPAVTLAASGPSGYTRTVAGLTAGHSYAIGVRGCIGDLDDGNTIASLIGDGGSAPDSPEELAAAVVDAD